MKSTTIKNYFSVIIDQFPNLIAKVAYQNDITKKKLQFFCEKKYSFFIF